jgi:signal transduction histidine kinase
VQVPGGPALVAWATGAGGLRAGVAGSSYLSSLVEDVRGEASSRRTLLTASLAAIGLVLLTGWYFILRAIAREQRTAQLQTDFVSAVSHEFRSPLTSMAHLAEMLEADRFPSDESRRTAYGILARDTGRLRRLVEDLLDFRRFEAGTATLHREPVDLVDVVRALVTDVQHRVAPAGYHIELSAPGTPVHSSVDREALSTALGNLLDNAIKYSPECRTVWVEIAREAGRVAITVRDRGIGIPGREGRHVFDRFVRGAQPKAMGIKGTGIGLAMVRHIVRAHGGEVRMASEAGRGSRFTIVLPEGAAS